MDAMVMRSATNDTSMMMDSSLNSQQGFDLVKVLWRWKWLPILGAIIGSGVGYMYYTKLPQQYQSSALVQVLSPIPYSIRSELYDTNKVGAWGSSGDESRAIRSRTVLELAVKEGDLEKKFPGMSAEQIIGLLSSKGGVEVQPADKSAATTQQLIISFTSQDPQLARDVVEAVVLGYQSFLKQEYQNADSEVMNYFSAQQKTLAKKQEELRKKLDELKKAAPRDVLWNKDLPIDPYFDRCSKRLSQADDLQEEINTLKADITQVTDSLNKGRKPEELLMMISKESETIWRAMLGESGVKQRVELESEKLRRVDLLQLQTEEATLKKTLAEAHPSVLRVQGQIEMVEARISAAEAAEKRFLDSELADQKDKQTQQQLRGPDYLLNVILNSNKEKVFSKIAQEKELRRMAAEDMRKSHEFQSVVSELQIIDEESSGVRDIHKAITLKLEAADLAPKNVNQRSLKELDPASPGGPAGPFPSRYLLGGAAVGMLLMSGLAVLMDLADRSYRSPEEIVSDLGFPVLGHIPAMDPKKLKKSVDGVDTSVVTLHHGRGRVAESFRSIRTSMFFSNKGADLKVVQITSPVPGDGKSTLSANLAVALAQSGRKVLLIDADFRRPRIEKIFGIEQSIGMVQLVTGKAEIDQALFKSCVPNLTILPGGKRPSNPAELLSSSKFSQLIDVLREKFDLIIIDTPPVLAVSDPAVVASVVDGVVVTMRLRRNIKPLATRTLSTLEAVDAPVIGIVVNGVSAEAAYGGYGYNYSYNDYRYSYRYSENNYSYGKYREYSAGYVEDDTEHLNTESDNANSAT
jgi:polysaccharide biosynthesis transport protein